ncbi:MAG: hypothetical protein CK424_06460 [Legionella sp.]|nr:MAG: hypothetical protein CK424_06460 [Legionella sp.]
MLKKHIGYILGYLAAAHMDIVSPRQFSSEKVHCERYCEKHHRNSRIEYYHHMLGAVLVYPDHREVIPLAPEPIVQSDGDTKNDCEKMQLNETFNTLKNQGYNFEHNYGHGYKNLCSVMTMLMMLAFLMDQVQ